MAAAAAATNSAAPAPVRHMDELLHTCHGVFVKHGFKPTAGAESLASTEGANRVQYVSDGGMEVVASYIAIQQHLMVYAQLASATDVVHRAKLQLGMAPGSVQDKLDYLVVYPLMHRSRIPALADMPSSVIFGMIGCLGLPALAAAGATSQNLAAASIRSDIMWWQVLQALPQSPELKVAMESIADFQKEGKQVEPGTFRNMVKDEVERVREEAVAKRKEEERRERIRREEEIRQEEMRRRVAERNPLMVHPPRRPGLGPLGPGGGGFDPFGGDDMGLGPITVGGRHDMMPGGLGGPLGGPGLGGPRRGGGGLGGPDFGGPFGPGGFGPGRGGGFGGGGLGGGFGGFS